MGRVVLHPLAGRALRPASVKILKLEILDYFGLCFFGCIQTLRREIQNLRLKTGEIFPKYSSNPAVCHLNCVYFFLSTFLHIYILVFQMVEHLIINFNFGLYRRAWDMEFNPSKCQVLHISRSRRPIKHSYTMQGQVLDSIDHARYLGVDISSDLNFNHHINRITANASKSLGFLKKKH